MLDNRGYVFLIHRKTFQKCDVLQKIQLHLVRLGQENPRCHAFREGSNAGICFCKKFILRSAQAGADEHGLRDASAPVAFIFFSVGKGSFIFPNWR